MDGLVTVVVAVVLGRRGMGTYGIGIGLEEEGRLVKPVFALFVVGHGGWFGGAMRRPWDGGWCSAVGAPGGPGDLVRVALFIVTGVELGVVARRAVVWRSIVVGCQVTAMVDGCGDGFWGLR